MDDSARGIATAALTLQSVLLRPSSAKLCSQEPKRLISWIAAFKTPPAILMPKLLSKSPRSHESASKA